MRKNTERSDPFGFFNIHSVAKDQKIEGGPFADLKKFPKKSLTKPKRGTKVYPGDVVLVSLLE